ncbi:MAG TPA: alkaline phosphatase family protein [Chloroflexota bacterium]
MSGATLPQARASATATPIEHVVVIFQENVSFDHYFATYPNATNPAGEPRFVASPDTPTVNGLTGGLLTNNPNSHQPFRLDRSRALTCDQDHNYTDEQKAFDSGLMDKFVEFVGRSGANCQPGGIDVMGYYDGNTVTGLWNYAQHFAMNDNSFSSVFGPSTPGALNLISGQTHGATPSAPSGAVVQGTDIGDLDPTFDDCSGGTLLTMTGKNLGDLLNAKNVTWGWFEGGFRPTSTTGGKAVCGSTHTNIGGASVTDYIPHHQPFQYYQSTSNPHHLQPSAANMIGKTDQANHQYDLTDFWTAVDGHNMPAVSYLKAAAYQDGHAGYSDPLDEQTFLVQTINRLQRAPEWNSTAVIVLYDDSDGWYDHVIGPIVSQSNTTADALRGGVNCGTAPAGAYEGRCGYGPRQPFLVISPWAEQNSVDHTTTDQSSVLRFIEDNWTLGRIGDQSFDALAGPLTQMFDFGHGPRAPKLFLDPSTGTVDRDRGNGNDQGDSQGH